MSTRAAQIAAACSLCAALTMASEGLVKIARPDPVGIPTACYGHTAGVVNGEARSAEACLQLLHKDLLEHGTAADGCIRVSIPLKARAAFTDFAFNAGVGAFCHSTLNRKLNAGDLAGACAELSRWVYAGGKPLPGLVERRATERAWCEAGLAGR